MTETGGQIAAAIAECKRELSDSALPGMVDALRRETTDQRFETVLRSVLAAPDRQNALLALSSTLGRDAEHNGNGAATLQRALLTGAALESLEKLPNSPLEASVKSRLCEYYRFFVRPAAHELRLFDANQYSFLVFGKIALLERFPGGQFDWEISGFPRSWLAKVPLASLPRVAYFLSASLKGFSPCIVPHMAYRRKNPLMLVQRECEKAWYRMAMSAELQPQIRGLVACSWFFSRETFKVSPHLSFVLQPFSESGALITTRGKATENEGFLSGSAARRKLYQDGAFKPTMGLVLWSRDQMIRWAHSHPELADT
jgi:hypothetical protein